MKSGAAVVTLLAHVPVHKSRLRERRMRSLGQRLPMDDYIDKDIYGRGADIIFGKGAAELTKRQALLKLKAIRDAKVHIKPGEYIEYDLYGRGDPRIFGKNAHIANYEQAAKELARRQRPDRFSLRKALRLPSTKLRQLLKLLQRKSLTASSSEEVIEVDEGLNDTSYSGRAADKYEDGLTKEIGYSSINAKQSSDNEASPANLSRPESLTSKSPAESGTAFANRVINIRRSKSGEMQAVLHESPPHTDVSEKVHAPKYRSMELSIPAKSETDSEPVRNVVAVSGLRKLFETSEDAKSMPVNDKEWVRTSSARADSTTSSRSKSSRSSFGSLDHDSNSSARLSVHPSMSKSEHTGVSSQNTKSADRHSSVHRVRSKLIHSESSPEIFAENEHNWEKEASITGDFFASGQESTNDVERPLVEMGPLSTLFAESQVASNDHHDITRSDIDAGLENSAANFHATENEPEESDIVPTSVSALSKLLSEPHKLDREPSMDSATFSAQNIQRYQSISEQHDQTSFEHSLPKVLIENTDNTIEFVNSISVNTKDASLAEEASPVSVSSIAKLFSETRDGHKDKAGESVSYSSHQNAQPNADEGDADLLNSFEKIPQAEDTKPESKGSASSSSGSDDVLENSNPVIEISSSESASSAIREDDDLSGWSSDLVEPVIVSDNFSLDFTTRGLDTHVVVSKQRTPSESSSEREVDDIGIVPEQKNSVSPNGSQKEASAKIVPDDSLEPLQKNVEDERSQTLPNVESSRSNVLRSKEEHKQVTKTKSKGFWERLFGFSKSREDTNQHSVEETTSARDVAVASVQIPPRVHPGIDDTQEKTSTHSLHEFMRDDMPVEKRFSSGAGPSSDPRPTFGSAEFDFNDQNINWENSIGSARLEAAAPHSDQAGIDHWSPGRHSPKHFPRGKSNIKRADTLLDVRMNSAAGYVHSQPDSRIVEQSSSVLAAGHVPTSETEHADTVRESTMDNIASADRHSGGLSRRESNSDEGGAHVDTISTDTEYDSIASSDEYTDAGRHSNGGTDFGGASFHMNEVTTDSGYDSVGSSDDYI